MPCKLSRAMDDNVIARNYRKAWNPTQMCNRIFLPCLVDTYFFPRLRWHWPDTNTHTHISINIIDIRTMCIPVDIIIRHTYVTVQHGGIELTILSFDFQNEVLNRKTTKRSVMLRQGSHNLRSLYNQWCIALLCREMSMVCQCPLNLVGSYF